jgi:integrase
MDGHVRKRGDKWYYSFEAGTVDGKRKRVERVGGRTKKEALAALREALQEYDNAGLHFEPSEISVADYLDYWLKNYVELECRPNTVDGYTRIIDKHIKPSIGSYRIRTITAAVLQEFVNQRSFRGFSANYMTNIFTVLSGSFKAAVYPYQFIKENPMHYVKKPKHQYKKEETSYTLIKKEDYERILERFPLGNTFHMPLQIAYHTGLRIGEVTSLTWDDIDFEKGTISVNKNMLFHREIKEWYLGPTKTKSSVRTIRIGNTLLDLLQKHKKMQTENRLKYGPHYLNNYTKKIQDNNGEDIWVVFSMDSKLGIRIAEDPLHLICTKEDGSPVTNNSIKYLSRVINYELMIQFNFHSLRHTHATTLLENGANIKDVQQRLGHGSMSTTYDTYLHVTEKMSDATVDIFEKALTN